MAMTRNPDVRDVLNQVVNDPRYAEVMRVPVISPPQIALAMTALGLFAGATLAYLHGMVPLWVAMSGNLVAVYLAFTPLHDASHRAVSHNGFLNDLIGVITGQLLLPGINMTAFRAIHMDHHRYTGQEGRDPDTAFVKPPFGGVFYLMFADIHWVFWYLRYGRHYWSRKVACYMALLLVMVVGVHVALLMSPWWKEFLLLYVVPQRLGLGWVAYTFAHIQHPHGLTWDNAPFQSTMYIRGTSPFRRLMFGQEEHIIHHVVPHVPWFKYKRVWDLGNGVLHRQNIPGRGWMEGPGKIEPQGLDTRKLTPVRVTGLRDGGEAIRVLELETLGDAALPLAGAGAHVDVHLPGGLTRQYSLVDADTNRLTIAVKHDATGRGGSRAIHELAVGDTLEIGRPRNNFVLYETAPAFLLIAGGIGVTPLLSMAHRLIALDKPFTLHLCARDEATIPLREDLQQGPLARHVALHLDSPDGRGSLDPGRVLANPDGRTMLYLCGPQPFMNWLREAALAQGWDPAMIRIESFSAPQADEGTDHAFTVHLTKKGRDVRVGAEETIIDALAKVGIDMPFACMQGTCGTCVTPVLQGTVAHRDAYLSEEEKLGDGLMCLCVSRARGDSLSLDI